MGPGLAGPGRDVPDVQGADRARRCRRSTRRWRQGGRAALAGGVRPSTPCSTARCSAPTATMPPGMEGHWTEYRRAAGADGRPRRCSRCCGFGPWRSAARCAAGMAWCWAAGRRVSVYQPGLWQLPPAGSVDRGADRGGTADLRAAPDWRNWRRSWAGAGRRHGGPEARCAWWSIRQGVLDLGCRSATPLPGRMCWRRTGRGAMGSMPTWPSCRCRMFPGLARGARRRRRCRHASCPVAPHR